MGMFLGYIKELYALSPIKFLVNGLLMVMLGVLESVGILMVIPLLIVAGVIPGVEAASGLIAWIDNFLRALGVILTLPLVLLLYVGIIVGQSWLQRYQTLLNTGIQQSYVVHLSTRLFRAVAYADWQYLVSKAKSDISNVLITELLRVHSGIQVFLQMISAATITLLQVVVAFLVAPGLTSLVLASAIVLLVALRGFVKKARRIGEELSDLNQGLYFTLTEHLNGIKEIKSYGIEEAQVANYNRVRVMMKNNIINFARIQTGLTMLNKVGSAVLISVFLFFAIAIFKLNPQEFIVITVIAARIWPRVLSLQSSLQHINSVLPAFHVVKNLENQCLAAQENFAEDGAATKLQLRRGVEFRHVSFGYAEERAGFVVEEASFELPVGTTTAFVGSSGAGKSTMVDLLMGLLKPVKGEILVDGEPLDDNLRSWRRSIGYVPQEPFLLNATIRDNLLWACPEATEEQMWEALRLASVEAFVQSLPDGLGTVVGDRGVRLSGGERQRVVLARALLRKPSVLILDEATSSLDSENEKRIQQAIESLQGKLTIVVIAHRISTIRNADNIIVLEQGRIIEIGNYQSLMNNKYSRFYALANLSETAP
ncbi:Heterocyst differentiation ATP-binding protein HepA [Sporotomaculum syntrophicum]|uniref:Heterocyst differentiation ATP-binding protein HepA n=1 Tax=Sporotomaculum syntrophicum TaxID=182264 RepID=A0A9D3AZ17_9FIRM|nr:ABC transporter ATP-binding protein [Sporotomaculum syntrophicum]KAF1086081.1 Heterocyst differentiation ATP-binding protein HepA [Sporotomaculum syntrophicum]